MKIRNGFVSNSSSSSFICDVCHEEYSGMDACLADFEMSCCVKGHCFCNDHSLKALSDFDLEEKRKLVVEYSYIEEDKDQALRADEDTLEELFDEFSGDITNSMPSYTCPCCNLVAISTDQLIEYLLHERHQDRKQVEAEIKARYINYEAMLKDMK